MPEQTYLTTGARTISRRRVAEVSLRITDEASQIIQARANANAYQARHAP